MHINKSTKKTHEKFQTEKAMNKSVRVNSQFSIAGATLPETQAKKKYIYSLINMLWHIDTQPTTNIWYSLSAFQKAQNMLE